MSNSQRIYGAAKKINWTALMTAVENDSLKHKALIDFRKKYQDLARQLQTLKETTKDVDFNYYESKLSNKKVVDQVRTLYKQYKPTQYNKDIQLKIVEQYQQRFIESARRREADIQDSVKEISKAIENVDKSRPIAQLTIEDMIEAFPEYEDEAVKMINNGKFFVDGVDEKFGKLSML